MCFLNWTAFSVGYRTNCYKITNAMIAGSVCVNGKVAT